MSKAEARRPAIEEIEARAARATEGPWGRSQFASMRARFTVEARGRPFEIAHEVNLEDADFIASARTDIPALCRYVVEIEKRTEKMERVIEAAKKWHASRTDYLIECEIALSTHAPTEGGVKYRAHAAASAMAASDLVDALALLTATEGK